MTAVAPTVEAFFTQQLAVQATPAPHRRRLSRHAAAVLVFARNRTGTPPSRLDVGDIDATLVAAFLTHLETGRGNSVSTRNYPAHRHPLPLPLRRTAPSPNTPSRSSGARHPGQTT